MTNLPNTTTEAGQREASMVLARLMGELSECTCGELGCNVGRRIDGGNGWFVPKVNNFYAPANMPLAWHALNWAIKQRGHVGSIADWWTYEAGGGDGIDPTGWLLLKFSPADAQRAWLDKILSLAIEAGMVQE